mgnify:CR=1 FL=1
MREWYKNSSAQMSDPEMEFLQSFDAASCAVWEWAKGTCKKRERPEILKMTEVEESIVSRRLGITPERFRSIIGKMSEVGWVKTGNGVLLEVVGWESWQAVGRTSDMDAKRKRNSYWQKKTESGENTGIKLSVPEGLQDADFLRVWREWIAYRRSHPAPIADERMFFQKQLLWLDEYGARRGAKILNMAMRNSWQGLEAAAKVLSRD